MIYNLVKIESTPGITLFSCPKLAPRTLLSTTPTAQDEANRFIPGKPAIDYNSVTLKNGKV
jgi:hypothetical protein